MGGHAEIIVLLLFTVELSCGTVIARGRHAPASSLEDAAARAARAAIIAEEGAKAAQTAAFKAAGVAFANHVSQELHPSEDAAELGYSAPAPQGVIQHQMTPQAYSAPASQGANQNQMTPQAVVPEYSMPVLRSSGTLSSDGAVADAWQASRSITAVAARRNNAGNVRKKLPSAKDFAPIVQALEGLLKKTEEALKFGGSDDRLAFCKDIQKTYVEIDKNFKFAQMEPHSWALGEANREINWLCVGWQPERKLKLKSHLTAMKDVYKTYVESLQCSPGMVPCQKGTVVGFRPTCACQCHAGWLGDACSVASCKGGCSGHGQCLTPDQCTCDDDWVGPHCGTLLTYSWVTGAWKDCPAAKGTPATRSRVVACRRSDGFTLKSEEECATEGCQMGCVKNLQPVDAEPCCVPLQKHDVLFQDCGTVDDGCGGVIDFGPCAHDTAKLEEQAAQLVVQAQEGAKTVKLEERRLLNLEEELEELKEEAKIAEEEAQVEAGVPPPAPGTPVADIRTVPQTEAQVEIEQEIIAKVEELKKSKQRIEAVEEATVAKVQAAQKIQHRAKKALRNRPCSPEKPCTKGVPGCIADDECASGLFCWHFYTGKGHGHYGLQDFQNTCWDCSSFNAKNGCGTTASCPCE